MGTMLSRVSGCARDIAIAFCFGSAPELAAFMVSYRFANLFRRLFGDGNVSAGFIPYFSSLHETNPTQARLFYRDSVCSLSAVLISLILVLESALWVLLPFLSADWEEIARLTMYMIPGLLFVCLYALNVAFLQFHKHYFIGGAAPVLFNMLWIVFAFLGAHLPIEKAIHVLALGVSIAFALQWCITLYQVRAHLSLSWRLWLQPSFFSADWKKMLRPLSLGVIGIGAVQINSALDALFARFADLAGPAYLWYAIRIEQLPLALFGIALSGALLPPLSRAFAEGAFSRYQELLRNAISSSIALFIPCTVALFVLGSAGVNLLYGHGDFQPNDVKETTYCLWGYGVGLFPAVVTLLLAAGFYAKKSYGVPTAASLASVLLHIMGNSIMVFGLQWGALSVALSTSLAAWVNCSILTFWMAYRFEIKVFDGMLYSIVRLSVASGIGAVCAWGFGLLFEEFSRSFITQVARVGGLSVMFVSGFLAVAYLLNIKEFFEIVGKKKPRPETI